MSIIDPVGTNGLIVELVSSAVVPDTDGVRCFRFACGHERIIARADYNRQKIGCAQCEVELAPHMLTFRRA
jgi:hypothetical protein